MGLLDDNGPEMNSFMNMALFKVPSTRAPGEVADDVGAGVVVLGALAAVGFGGYYAYQALVSPAEPEVTAQIRVDNESGIAASFADYRRQPLAGQIENVRALAGLYDALGLRTAESPNQEAVMEDCTAALLRIALDRNFPGEKQPALVIISTHLNEQKHPGKAGVGLKENPLVRKAVKDVLFEITSPG